MPHPSLSFLFCALGVLLILAAFFAGTETALMSLNRYRLRHQTKAGNRGARLAEKLLARPDRLIGLILLLSTIVNVTAPMLVSVIAIRLGGDYLLAFAAVLLTIVLLIFCEVAPKTYGALHPARLALPAAYVYTALLWVLYPFVWATNLLANGVLRLLGVSPEQASHSLSSEELRTVVAEAGAMIPQRHRQMLMSLLDLEKATVEDIMVPRVEIVGIDVDDPWEKILEQLRQAQHTRLPVFEGDIEHIVGVLHMKRVVHELARGRWDREQLIEAASTRDAYFVPSGTPLNTQLLNFQRDKRRMAFVVDEYGDIQGLVTLEDILEEIVGEFTTDPATMMHKDLHREAVEEEDAEGVDFGEEQAEDEEDVELADVTGGIVEVANDLHGAPVPVAESAEQRQHHEGESDEVRFRPGGHNQRKRNADNSEDGLLRPGER